MLYLVSPTLHVPDHPATMSSPDVNGRVRLTDISRASLYVNEMRIALHI